MSHAAILLVELPRPLKHGQRYLGITDIATDESISQRGHKTAILLARAFRALFSLNVEIALRAREKWEWILEQLDVHIAQQRVVPALEDVKHGERLHVGLVREIGRAEIGRFGRAVECVELQQNARHVPFLESLHEQAIPIHTA